MPFSSVHQSSPRDSREGILERGEEENMGRHIKQYSSEKEDHFVERMG